jgi:hypothetical protein
MIRTILMIGIGFVIAGVLGLFIFFAVSARSTNCCNSSVVADADSSEVLPPCCATTTAN